MIQSEQEQTLLSAKTRLESEKFDLTELLDKRNREVDRLTGQRLNSACISNRYIFYVTSSVLGIVCFIRTC